MSENGHSDTPPSEWEAHEKAIERVGDPAVRESLWFGLERDREAHMTRARQGREFEKFKVALFGDIAMLLKAVGRVESKGEVTATTVNVVAAKQAASERDFQQLARETGGHRVSLAELERRQAAAEKALAQNTSKYALERVRFDERLAWLDRRQDKLEGTVADTGEHVAVIATKADLALESAHEIGDVVKDTRAKETQIETEKRDDVRWSKRHRAGIVAMGLIAVLTAALGYAVWRLEQQEAHGPARPAATEVR